MLTDIDQIGGKLRNSDILLANVLVVGTAISAPPPGPPTLARGGPPAVNERDVLQ